MKTWQRSALWSCPCGSGQACVLGLLRRTASGFVALHSPDVNCGGEYNPSFATFGPAAVTPSGGGRRHGAQEGRG